jgi:asparagine synthase (glutamine-hydrolysing)
MAFYQDEPLGDPVCVPLYHVAKLARDNGVVVCQVGEGADELFHGYPSWITIRRLQSLNDILLTNPVRKLALWGLGLVGRVPERRLEYLGRGSRGEPVFVSGAAIFTEGQKQRVLASPLRARLSGLSSYDAVRSAHERFRAAAWEPTTVNWMSYADLRLRLPELLLMRVDKMSMAVSLEARVPFLDHEFVTLAMSIPSRMKVRGSVTKAMLKQAVRGILPENVIERPKQGFALPVRDWLGKLLTPENQGAIRRFTNESGLLDIHEIECIIESADPDRTWTILNLALWWELHFGNHTQAEM